MIRLLVLLLTLLTGFSGLVYEVTWQRYLATLLGSHSEATAAVLGLFLGGLALGYSVFGAMTRRLVASAQVTPEQAARSTDLFVSYYAHATPFPRAVLSDLWRRCQAEPAQQDACREGRAAADLRLGFLDAQLAETPDSAAREP